MILIKNYQTLLRLDALQVRRLSIEVALLYFVLLYSRVIFKK